MAYFQRDIGWAFVGDILFYNAIGAWEHKGGDLKQLIHSISTQLFPLGDEIKFVPGHGVTSTIGRERRENPFVGIKALSSWPT